MLRCCILWNVRIDNVYHILLIFCNFRCWRARRYFMMRPKSKVLQLFCSWWSLWRGSGGFCSWWSLWRGSGGFCLWLSLWRGPVGFNSRKCPWWGTGGLCSWTGGVRAEEHEGSVPGGVHDEEQENAVPGDYIKMLMRIRIIQLMEVFTTRLS